MAADLDEQGRARISRSGVLPLLPAVGLALFDTALSLGNPVTVPAKLDLAALRERAQAGTLPAALRGMVGMSIRRRGAGGAADAQAFRQRFAGLAEPEQLQAVLDLLRTHMAAVLGHATPDTVEIERGFLDMGFDSLTAVEFRNRIGAATGLRLSTTLVFDYPTPVGMARHLHAELLLSGAAAAAPAGDDAAIRAALASIPLDRFREAGLLETILRLADGTEESAPAPTGDQADAINAADVDELVRIALADADSSHSPVRSL
jgi:hypothetical protein